MKLHQLDRSSLLNRSFTVSHNKYPHFLKLWHYHVEFELVYIIKSTGTGFIGDSIEKFEKGALVLIGSKLPHMWLNDDPYFEKNSKLKAEALAIHFKDDFVGNMLTQMPETSHITELLNKASQGIKFIGNTEYISKRLDKLRLLKGFDSVLEFLKILDLLAQHKDYKLLSSLGFVNVFNTNKSQELTAVYEYIFENFKGPISLQEVADIAKMNPSAFSRSFKRINRKTFSEYLSSVRVGYACKLLMENKYNIAEVCYESGFNNISNFNRQFKAITKHAPKDYLKLHLTQN